MLIATHVFKSIPRTIVLEEVNKLFDVFTKAPDGTVHLKRTFTDEKAARKFFDGEVGLDFER